MGLWKGFMQLLKQADKFEIRWDEKPKDNYVCKGCHYGWTSRKKFGSPAFCPRCKSNSIIKVDSG